MQPEETSALNENLPQGASVTDKGSCGTHYDAKRAGIEPTAEQVQIRLLYTAASGAKNSRQRPGYQSVLRPGKAVEVDGEMRTMASQTRGNSC